MITYTQKEKDFSQFFKIEVFLKYFQNMTVSDREA